MMRRTSFLTLLWISGVFCVYTPEKDKEIRQETVLADTYDPLSRPSATTNVSIGITFLSIDELNLPDQKFAASGWIVLEWYDPRLTWSLSDKDDIEAIYVEPASIWKPEMVIDNSIEELGVINDEDVSLHVHYDGRVAWEPPMKYIVHCEIDVTYYPYDQQKCGVDITSWFSKDEMALVHLSDSISLEDYRENGEWEVVSSDVSSSEITETKNGKTKAYDELQFWIYVQRRDQFYNTNVMLPIVLSSFLVILVFVVPVECGEKLSYTLTILLTIAVFLTIIGETLPAISLTTSVLGLYLAATLIESAVATLLTVGILYIYHKKDEPKPGTRFYNLSMNARKLCHWKDLGQKKKTPEDGDEGKVEPEGSGSGDNLTWVQIAEVWDRLCFFISLILTLLLNIIFIAILAIGGTLRF